MTSSASSRGDPAAATGSMEKAAVIGALQLYLDFINLFLFLLRLSGGRSSRRIRRRVARRRGRHASGRAQRACGCRPRESWSTPADQPVASPWSTPPDRPGEINRAASGTGNGRANR